MGRVYLAEDETLGRTVAIKEISARFAVRPEARARFLREARSMATVEEKAQPGKRRVSEEVLRRFFREMLLIRRFEEKVEERFRAGDLPGFLHVAIGQEAELHDVGQGFRTLRKRSRRRPQHAGVVRHGHQQRQAGPAALPGAAV
jgi:hypothetical protein